VFEISHLQRKENVIKFLHLNIIFVNVTHKLSKYNTESKEKLCIYTNKMMKIEYMYMSHLHTGSP